MLYLEETERMVQSLGDSGKDMNALFQALFRRDPRPGETIAGELATINAAMHVLYDKNKSMLIKNPKAREHLNQIWTRKLTPQELFSSTASSSYNEIGLRTNRASDEVRASHARFAGIVLEKSMALSISQQREARINIPNPAGVLPRDLEEIIEAARRSRSSLLYYLNIFFKNFPAPFPTSSKAPFI